MCVSIGYSSHEHKYDYFDLFIFFVPYILYNVQEKVEGKGCGFIPGTDNDYPRLISLG